MHRSSSEREGPCRVDCRTRPRVTGGAFQEEWADKSRAVQCRRFLQACCRDKPRKSIPSCGDRAVPAGRTVPAPDRGDPRLILRRLERARDCRAWHGQGSVLQVEGRFVATGPVLLRSWFPFRYPRTICGSTGAPCVPWRAPQATSSNRLQSGEVRVRSQFEPESHQ